MKSSEMGCSANRWGVGMRPLKFLWIRKDPHGNYTLPQKSLCAVFVKRLPFRNVMKGAGLKSAPERVFQFS